MIFNFVVLSDYKNISTTKISGFTVYRSADIPTRQRYVRLVESVKENGGTVRIFSSLHVSGERES